MADVKVCGYYADWQETYYHQGAKQIAMSRTLGAAFLNHQVEQLEKSVGNVHGPSSGNWRDRTSKYGSGNHNNSNNSAPKRVSKMNNSRKRDGEFQLLTKDRDSPKPDQGSRRSSNEQQEKDADIVIVDASVLVHALNHLKKWCKNGRQEVVIVPLEALNTLDLLKKGTTSLAQRARAASRILEAQVGNNPRIRVQRDEAFVPWDSIDFQPDSDTSDGKAPPHNSPEWVRRTICCARWEVEHATPLDEDAAMPKVVLAVCTAATTSPLSFTTKLPDADANSTAFLNPVPLPAPSHYTHSNKHEPRTMGSHVSRWAAKAGVTILDVKAAPPPPQSTPKSNGSTGYSGRPRSPSEEDRPKRILSNKGARRPPTAESDKLKGGLVERSPAVLAMMEMVQRPDSKAVRVLARGEKLDPDT
ncbi:hypothetical protein J3R30DRAFT_3866815 [Lentinula aciculospora]|uniref:PIN domain-containing protein n=1 Tax=Lentinula aciculospora TaxID=153920 RepID=A0A9W9AEX8_9AGAR|nr:hypothetical protein J3R30DRAFT_3866815 [Lentinula aciculospora]